MAKGWSRWVNVTDSRMPKATHVCQDMTRPPRILVGAASAEKKRDRDLFETHANTQQDTANDQLLPVLTEGRIEGRKDGKNSSNEDGHAATEKIVDRLRYPRSAAASQGFCDPMNITTSTYKIAMAM